MSTHAENWARLVQRTRHTPLFGEPQVVVRSGRVTIRRKRAKLLFTSIVLLTFTPIFSYGAYDRIAAAVVRGSPTGWYAGILALMFAFIAGYVLVRQTVLTGRLSWESDGRTLTVRYGFVLSPQQLELDARILGASVQPSSETNLARGGFFGKRGLHIVALRWPAQSDDEAYLIWSFGAVDAVKAFDALASFVGAESVNRLVDRIELSDGRTVELSKGATWQAGRYHWRANKVAFRSSRFVEIKQKLLRTGHGGTTFADPPAYPCRLVRKDGRLDIRFSDGHEESVDLSKCLAVQVCKQEPPGGLTRYEVNLVIRSPELRRKNLLSYDCDVNEEPADLHCIAQQLGSMCGLPVLNHL